VNVFAVIPLPVPISRIINYFENSRKIQIPCSKN